MLEGKDSSPESKGFENNSVVGFGAGFATGATDDVDEPIRAAADPPPATTAVAGVV